MSALVKLDSQTVSSDTAVVQVGASNWSTAYNVYIIQMLNVRSAQENVYPNAKFWVGGSVTSDSTYDWMARNLRTYSSFNMHYGTNQNHMRLSADPIGTGSTHETFFGTFFIYNANNSSEYTHMSQESTGRDKNQNFQGLVGGYAYHTNAAVNGLRLYMSSGDIATATVNLYGLAKWLDIIW